MKRRLVILVGLLASVSAWVSASAAVSQTTLKHLTAVADTIVVGSVVEVTDIEGVSVAILSVAEILKGKPSPRVAYFAEGQWLCDVTAAQPGENGIYFLEPYEFDPAPAPRLEDPDTWSSNFKEPIGFSAGVQKLGLATPLFQVVWAGRGRLPSRELQGQRVVDIWTFDISVPKSIETFDGPDPEHPTIIRSAPFDAIRKQIRRWVR